MKKNIKLFTLSVATTTIIAGIIAAYAVGSGGSISSSGITFPSNNDVCTGANESAVRYNNTLKIIEFCDGTGWISTKSSGVSTISQNGYTTLPNGLIIQWGSETYYDSSEITHYVSYPLVFPNEVFSFQATPKNRYINDPNNAWRDDTWIQLISKSINGATIQSQYSGAGNHQTGFDWVAIGR